MCPASTLLTATKPQVLNWDPTQLKLQGYGTFPNSSFLRVQNLPLTNLIITTLNFELTFLGKCKRK